MAKHRSQFNKENEAPQTRSGLEPGLQDMPGEATPMPQARAFLEVTPELSPPSPSKLRAPLGTQASKAKAPFMSPLGAQAEAAAPSVRFNFPQEGLAEAESLSARTMQLPTPPATPYAVSGPERAGPAESDLDETPGPAVRGLDKLAPIDIWEDEPVAWSEILFGEMPVKNTFINFTTISPATRAATKELSGNSEPRSFPFHRQPFTSRESEPTAIVDDPVVIRLQDSLAPSVPGKDNRRIQLNLSVWIPPSSSSQSNSANQPAQLLSLADHLAPHAISQPVARPFTASHGDADASGDTVRRRLEYSTS